MSFRIYGLSQKTNLNDLLWTPSEFLKPLVRKKLLIIADKFFESVNVNVQILDVKMVGSMASYNYNATSDIDLHIVIDFDSADCAKDLLKELVDAKKNLFNSSREIKIEGIEVEVYIEDVNENNASDAVYSIKNNQWIVKPKIMTVPEVNRKKIEQLFNGFKKKIDNLKNVENPIKRLDIANSIKDRLKQLRKMGLASKEKNFSTYNLLFKTLRSRKVIDDLRQIIITTSDELLSL